MSGGADRPADAGSQVSGERPNGRPEASTPEPLVRGFRADDETTVIALWTLCGLVRPWNDPARDIERRRAISDDLFLVACAPPSSSPDGADTAEPVVASAMGGYDGHRGWVYYVAVHPAHRGRGIARALMAELERRLLARGCPKLNLQVREENTAALDFYARLGFGIDRAVGLGKRLIRDG